MRTFMYEIRKHEKMNVSLSRNIHIIALPQRHREGLLVGGPVGGDAFQALGDGGQRGG